MRGDDQQQEAIFSYIGLEQRVPKEHPLRAIRQMADQALRELDAAFQRMYARRGRPSIAPEKLIRAQLLQVLYSVRSERQLMEQLDYNLLFRWFVGLNIDDPIWDVTVFTKNRERLIEGEVAEQLLLAVVEQARAHQLLSEEHFTVDGTLIQAWASRRSFREKSDPPSQGTGTRGRKLLRDTHESATDPEARLYKKSGAAAAVPSYLGHVVTENRNGLVVAAMVTQSSKTAEQEAALAMVDKLKRAAWDPDNPNVVGPPAFGDVRRERLLQPQSRWVEHAPEAPELGRAGNAETGIGHAPSVAHGWAPILERVLP